MAPIVRGRRDDFVADGASTGASFARPSSAAASAARFPRSRLVPPRRPRRWRSGSPGDGSGSTASSSRHHSEIAAGLSVAHSSSGDSVRCGDDELGVRGASDEATVNREDASGRVSLKRPSEKRTRVVAGRSSGRGMSRERRPRSSRLSREHRLKRRERTLGSRWLKQTDPLAREVTPSDPAERRSEAVAGGVAGGDVTGETLTMTQPACDGLQRDDRLGDQLKRRPGDDALSGRRPDRDYVYAVSGARAVYTHGRWTRSVGR